MTTINTHEFFSYTPSTFYEFIMLQNESHFQITFPKKNIAFKDDHFEVFWEYHLAAYAGHKLVEVADSFAYYVPSIYKTGYFKFEVEISDLQKFATILFPIISAYNKFGTDDEIINFQIAASEFFINAYEEEIEPYTWGLLFIANQFLCYL